MEGLLASRRRRVAAGLLALHVLVPLATIAQPGFGRDAASRYGDSGRFFALATADGVPGRDFRAEYPPLAVVGMRALGGRDVRDFSVRLAVVEWAADAAIALVLVGLGGTDAALVYLALSALFLPFLLGVFDLAVVAIALGAVALAQRRPRLGGVLLAVSAFVKPFGVLLLPAVGSSDFGMRCSGADGAREQRKRVRAAWAASAATLIGGGLAWFAWSGRRGVLDVATYRASRGWHVESTPGVLLAVLGRRSGRMEQGALRIGAPPAWAGALIVGSTLVAILLWWGYAMRRPGRPEVGALGAFAIWFLGATLLSPQFIAWFLPLVALAYVRGARRVATAGAVVVGLSVARLAIHAEDTAAVRVLVAVRVVALVAVIVAAARELDGRNADAPPAGAPLAVPS